MGKTLGQPVVVENKPSAGSIVASQAVATARPDGHTLLLISNGNAVSVGLLKKLPYDTLKDFAPVTTLGFFDIGLFVPATSRFTTLPDVVVFAKANPGKLNVGRTASPARQRDQALGRRDPGGENRTRIGQIKSAPGRPEQQEHVGAWLAAASIPGRKLPAEMVFARKAVPHSRAALQSELSGRLACDPASDLE